LKKFTFIRFLIILFKILSLAVIAVSLHRRTLRLKLRK